MEVGRWNSNASYPSRIIKMWWHFFEAFSFTRAIPQIVWFNCLRNHAGWNVRVQDLNVILQAPAWHLQPWSVNTQPPMVQSTMRVQYTCSISWVIKSSILPNSCLSNHPTSHTPNYLSNPVLSNPFQPPTQRTRSASTYNRFTETKYHLSFKSFSAPEFFHPNHVPICTPGHAWLDVLSPRTPPWLLGFPSFCHAAAAAAPRAFRRGSDTPRVSPQQTRSWSEH